MTALHFLFLFAFPEFLITQKNHKKLQRIWTAALRKTIKKIMSSRIKHIHRYIHMAIINFYSSDFEITLKFYKHFVTSLNYLIMSNLTTLFLALIDELSTV